MSRRARFLETISNIFDFQRNRTGKSIVLFICGAATFGWVVTAVFNSLSLLAKWLLQRPGAELVERPHIAFQGVLIELGVSAAGFMVALAFMYRNYRRNTGGELVVERESPTPHRALITLLSTYAPRRSRFGGVAEVEAGVGDADAREQLLKSNWGPLVVAIEHHRGELQHCWVVCTAGGSEPQYPAAEKVAKRFAGEALKCHKVVLDNPYDIGAMVSKVTQIYSDAALVHNLEPEHLIADFTGGTAAMTGGMILATVDDNREIEYLRQDKPLVIDGKARPPEEIKRERALISISTSRALVPTDKTGQK